MPRITPIHYKKLAKIFEKKGFTHLRTEGDHLIYRLVFPMAKTSRILGTSAAYL